MGDSSNRDYSQALFSIIYEKNPELMSLVFDSNNEIKIAGDEEIFLKILDDEMRGEMAKGDSLDDITKIMLLGLFYMAGNIDTREPKERIATYLKGVYVTDHPVFFIATARVAAGNNLLTLAYDCAEYYLALQAKYEIPEGLSKFYKESMEKLNINDAENEKHAKMIMDSIVMS